MRLEMGRADHQPVWLAALSRKLGKYPVEHTQAAPADEPLVDRLLRTMGRRRTSPANSIPDHEDNAAHDPSIVDPRDTVRERDLRLDPAHLRLAGQPKIAHGYASSASPMTQIIASLGTPLRYTTITNLGDKMLNSLPVRRIVSAMPRGGMRAAKILSTIAPKKRIFRMASDPSIRMLFDTRDIFQAEMAYGQYQPVLMKLIKQMAREGDRVLIAGAHIGYVPLTVAELGCDVIACEADPRNAKLCNYNFSLNPHLPISFVPYGLSDIDGSIPIWLSERSSNSSFAVAHSANTNAEVDVMSGDRILSNLGVSELDGLILDVEGWELKALEGLRRTLERNVPRWAIIESADWALAGAGTSEIALQDMIVRLGWRIVDRIGNDLVCSG